MAITSPKKDRIVVSDLGLIVPNYSDIVLTPIVFKPADPVANPTVNTVNGLYEFGPGVDTAVAFVFKLPHSWHEGSVITPNVRWRKKSTAAGNVTWKFGYEIKDELGVYTDTLAYCGYCASSPDTALIHQSTDLGEIDMTGLHISCVAVAKLTRIASPGHGDTCSSTVQMLQCGVRIMVDTLGSDGATSKTAV